MLALFLAWIMTLPAHARWATLDDASHALEIETAEYSVKRTGRYSVKEYRRIKVLKDEARERQGTKRLYYNSRASRLKIISARTINGKTRREVMPSMIQDKPLASVRQGFDQINQVLVAFPQVKVGSVLELANTREEREVPIQGFFSERFVFGKYQPELDSRAVVKSELPLHVQIHDPLDALEVKESREGALFVVHVRQKKPVHRVAVEEPDGFLPEDAFPQVMISSMPDWKSAFAPLVPTYEALSNAALPSSFQAIVQAATLEEKPEAKINVVTSKLAEEVHYWADWRPRRGGHIPRPLSEIASSQFGDCKDFALSTVAMLRKLGFEASVALIERGIRPTIFPHTLPSVDVFNHAIVWARHPSRPADPFWVDPTNLVSFAQGLFEDITDRQALILSPLGARLDRTPAADPRKSSFGIRLVLERTPEGDTLNRGELQMRGRIAAGWTGIELNRSREAVDLDLLRMLLSERRLMKFKVSHPSLTSRIAADFDVGMDVTERGEDLRSSAGKGYHLYFGTILQRLMARTDQRVADLFIGHPYSTHHEFRYAGMSLVGDASRIGCDIRTPWVEAFRGVTEDGDNIVIKDRVRTLVSSISSADLRSSPFAEAQAALRKCFESSALIVKD